jgi:catechol 2,3-dioxygenase-like lactoylglutathione lyase family enzyme
MERVLVTVLDHVGIHVADLARSSRFYTGALGALGHALVMSLDGSAIGMPSQHGFGRDGKPSFWIIEAAARGGPDVHGNPVGQGSHIAFTAPDRAAVDAFHAAAIAAGGRDNGPPGLRPHYHPAYYGAFVLDLDGNNIEAVCHVAE